MASSSSFASNSQYRPRWKYVVFLSFRGEDTRKTFTGHLYKGLKNRGIFTFLDDKRMEDGDSIPEELLKAIEVSQFAVVVFSKNFATSRWCLNELVKIMECNKQENGQTVIPIFYDVDPSHVRNQSGDFGKAFAKYELKYKGDAEGMQKVQRWRTALTAAANLKGRDIRGRNESEEIQQIVDQISSKLCKSGYSLSSLQDVVGIKAHLKKLKSLLQVEINDVRMVGIWGIGGVGKTTIARAIFDTLSYRFKAACFLADVKEKAKGNQLHSLQNILLSELLRKKHDYVYNKLDGKCMIPERLCSMKVLIVLDDIDHIDHLEYLAGDLRWFGDGSRVVITTRNRQLIENDDAIYEVSTLPDDEAMLLFNQHAFKNKIPHESFKMMSLEVLSHAKGLPLALKVWGSLLHRKDVTQWRRIVDKIKEKWTSEIVEKLKISYDGLEPEEQMMFLDMACFFRGYLKLHVLRILDSYNIGAECGLDVLIDKSLVFISGDDRLEMHDLIEDMGRYVVKMQKDLGEPSRIRDVEDFEEVMLENTESKAIKSIWLQHGRVKKLHFSKEVMKNMTRLKLLYINKFDTLDAIEYLPNSLAWIQIFGYPWEALPKKFEPKSLVHLDLYQGSPRRLCFETKHFPCLRRLVLSDSQNLMQTPDFSGMPNLEHLDLWSCKSLKEVHHSLGNCRKLSHLHLLNCSSLERFPCVCGESLVYLNLKFCSSLEIFPEIKRSSIQYLTQGELHLCHMKNLVALPSSICKLKCLVKLDVSYCFKLESLPEEIDDLENLEELDTTCTLISKPPSSIVRLNKLKVLSFAIRISAERMLFVFPRVNEGLQSLETLDLSYCNLIDGELPDDIGCLSSLKELNLSGNNFEHLPRSIAQLGALRCLDLSDCERLTQLPEFPVLLDTIKADWTDYRICNSLFQNLSLLQHDISASDSLSLRVITDWQSHQISMPRFPYRGIDGVPVNLPKNWYIHDSFLGFAVCCIGRLTDNTAHLIPLSDGGMSCITRKLVLSNHSKYSLERKGIHFFLIPFAGLWDISKANGKTPNDYRHIMFSSSEKNKYEFRLLYKDEHCPGTRRSRFDDSEHHDEASCSSSKKQRSHFSNK
ncbi:TMV resistance protein N-like [Capsicum annuum]|nr:TMV resistance protein N-like [Capsicum annuum]XP_047256536.1 TMV resistance protein N-like [Capsicum annuum]XP_047256537.1 TMV resistance protein N-like [Capsicum annuum]XP_047256538.1 TMV resistance protein N-like [Capsicum annuum]XP_047256539.1 TMV resistance protein N-like [Capsicum annuum]